jgi:3-dehydroquinate synthase
LTLDCQTLRVALGDRSYDIVIGQQILDETWDYLKDIAANASHAYCIVDSGVAMTHGRRVTENLSEHLRVDVAHVPSGETSKSIAELSRLWHEMLDHRADRGTIVFAIGGGVAGDLAGFAAASFARGLRLVQVPTTLLSQVDSSVGGKTGINLPRAKNIVGAFWQPSLVLIDVETLATLPTREYVSGMAEVVKYGVIMDAPFFDWIESRVDAILERDNRTLQYLIARSCELKAQVVSQDERETSGLRAILNFGHTFGHAIEAGTAYGAFLHGEAVATGMMLACKMAVKLHRIPDGLSNRIIGLLERLQLIKPTSDLGSGHMWELMQHDKKVSHGKLSFILPSRMGHVERVPDIPKELVIDVLRQQGFF